jgi:glycosyltransferase involved in cell wall biosynthesis
MKQVKILHLLNGIELGGAETRIVSLLKKLDKKKYKIHIAYLLGKPILEEDLKNSGIKVISLGLRTKFYIPLVIYRLIKLILKNRYDILHTHNVQASLLGRLIAKMLKVPVLISTQHSVFQQKQTGVIYKLERITWRLPDTIIALSEAISNYLKVNGKPKDVKVIHTGVNIKLSDDVDNKVQKEAFGIKYNSIPVIGTVGNLRYEKGYQYFLPAMKQVIKEIPNIKILIVGEGKLRNDYENLANSLGLTGNIIFTGYRKDVIEIMSLFDIFVLSSITEGFGRVLIEAMALTKPVVATKVDAIPEIVLDGETGILVPPKESDALAKAIIKLLKNSEMARKFGQAGRKRVEKFFILNKMVSDVENVYKECLLKKKL